MFGSNINSQSKVSVNSQKLSQMLDMYNNDDSGLRMSSTLKSPEFKIEEFNEISSFTEPVNETTSNKSSNSGGSNITNPERAKRSSILSTYSGVVEEGAGISFIVQNEQGSLERNSTESITVSSNHSQNTLKKNTQYDSYDNKVQENDTVQDHHQEVILKSNDNVKMVNKGSLNKSVTPSNTLTRNTSLKLLSINGHKKDMSSIASGNIASESGSSNYYNLERDNDYNLNNNGTIENKQSTIIANDIQIEDDHYVEPLTYPKADDSLNHINKNEEIKIPTRNKNRPISRIALENNLEEIEKQLEEELNDLNKPEISALQLPVLPESKNSSTDVFYSTTSFQINKSSLDEDTAYLDRPLPKSPTPISIPVAHSTEYLKSSSADHTITGDNNAVEENLDDYENITDDDSISHKTPTDQIIGRQSSTNSRKKSQNKKTRKKGLVSGFDVEALRYLVNSTQGGGLGSEFSDLGMKPEEKQSLQRLIDALSRLTADMVLDPNRYEEGLERLKKATRSLEGF